MTASCICDRDPDGGFVTISPECPLGTAHLDQLADKALNDQAPAIPPQVAEPLDEARRAQARADAMTRDDGRLRSTGLEDMRRSAEMRALGLRLQACALAVALLLERIGIEPAVKLPDRDPRTPWCEVCGERRSAFRTIAHGYICGPCAGEAANAPDASPAP